MGNIRWCLILGVVTAFSFVDQTALAASIKVKSSPELSCLSIIPGDSDQLVYPDDAVKRKDGGLVEVDIEFNSPTDGPSVSVHADSVAYSLIDAVRGYVKRYRLPCMVPGSETVKLHQSYFFSPNGGRAMMSMVSGNEASDRVDPQLACMVNVDGTKKPEFPRDAELRSQINRNGVAKFYYKLTFVAPDQPPEIEWIVAAPVDGLKRSVKRYAEGLRLPCMTAGPVSTKFTFNFAIDEGARTYLNDLDLRKMVGMAKNVPRPAKFNMTEMSCPFDLSIVYRQPYERNVVREFDNTDPLRKPLMDWVSTIELRFGVADSVKVFGDMFTLHVPCGVVDL